MQCDLSCRDSLCLKTWANIYYLTMQHLMYDHSIGWSPLYSNRLVGWWPIVARKRIVIPNRQILHCVTFRWTRARSSSHCAACDGRLNDCPVTLVMTLGFHGNAAHCESDVLYLIWLLSNLTLFYYCVLSIVRCIFREVAALVKHWSGWLRFSSA